MVDMETLVSLCKRRGFIFPGSEIYGGLANSWDYGPLGVELKNNIKRLWWKQFVHERNDMVGIDAALIMNPKVWEASGHVENFSDPLVDCKTCKNRFRFDQVPPDHAGSCGGELTEAKMFNLMFKTHLGPVENELSAVYLRPETAQAMFVDFKNVVDSLHKRIPFGIAQIGKAFRNEITPGNFIFRTREFEQMEIEYFIHPSGWEDRFEYWLSKMKEWLSALGIASTHLHYREIHDGERAHYSRRTVDIEYQFPFGQSELYGIAYRGDFDLSAHQKFSKQDLRYTDPATGEKFIPHVIEPTFGVDRTFLALLVEHYCEEEAPTAKKGETEKRVVLKLPPTLAPYQIAVLPLSKKESLEKVAFSLASELRKKFTVIYDETQSIGKRYRRQDEIGTPYCVTVDFDSLTDNAVTVRDRDTMKQDRIAITELAAFFSQTV